MERKKLFNLKISTGPYPEFVEHVSELARKRESKYACIANVHMLIEGYKDPHFASIVNGAHIVTPDGKPLTWALRLLYGFKQDRVSGMDILPDLLEAASGKGLSVYFYGGSQSLLDSAKKFIDTRYPSLITAGFYSPPFRELTLAEDEEIVERINQSGAQLVFVVLGCPKQERWMAGMYGKVNAVMIGVGGALSVLAGNQKRAPYWMQRAGLEWAHRLLQEPKRLFKRYAITNSLFIYLLVKETVKVRLIKRQVP